MHLFFLPSEENEFEVSWDNKKRKSVETETFWILWDSPDTVVYPLLFG